jgi:hypothetical protein
MFKEVGGKAVAVKMESDRDPTVKHGGLQISSIWHLPPVDVNPGSYDGAKSVLEALGNTS